MATKNPPTAWKQKMEQHIGLFIATIVIAAWAAGIGTYEGILKVAKLTTISSDKKELLEEQASASTASVDGLSPMVWRMNLELIVNEKTTSAWEEIVRQLSPIVVGGKKVVPLTVDMMRGTKTSEGELVAYWKPVAGSDKFTLSIAGSYHEQVPVPDGGRIEQAWGICGTSDQQYTRTRIKETQQVDVRILQIGGNERLPFFITIPLENGRPLPETFDVRTHLSTAEGVVVARARLE